MENKEIIALYRRQPGLDHQQRIDGKCPQVYDYRKNFKLSTKAIDFDFQDIWFAEDFEGLPLQESKNPVIVSGYFSDGRYGYSCMGSHESDPEYVACRTVENNADKIAELLSKKGASKIVIGREIDKRKTAQLCSTLQKQNLENKVEQIMSLPKEEQEKEVRRLLAYKAGVSL